MGSQYDSTLAERRQEILDLRRNLTAGDELSQIEGLKGLLLEAIADRRLWFDQAAHVFEIQKRQGQMEALGELALCLLFERLRPLWIEPTPVSGKRGPETAPPTSCSAAPNTTS